ncbi:hypothetical protein CB1_000820004 [Camelus ferus]|nr:hypothetical protein CB1_000820004 [Camelus ferus]
MAKPKWIVVENDTNCYAITDPGHINQFCGHRSKAPIIWYKTLSDFLLFRMKWEHLGLTPQPSPWSPACLRKVLLSLLNSSVLLGTLALNPTGVGLPKHRCLFLDCSPCFTSLTRALPAGEKHKSVHAGSALKRGAGGKQGTPCEERGMQLVKKRRQKSENSKTNKELRFGTEQGQGRFMVFPELKAFKALTRGGAGSCTEQRSDRHWERAGGPPPSWQERST